MEKQEVGWMFLTKDEAISLVLAFSKDHKISSRTKLNKLIARLNLFMLPVDVDFELNKFGSYSADLQLETTNFYETYYYAWEGKTHIGLSLSKDGESLSNAVIEQKVKRVLSGEEITNLRQTIYSLSSLPASQISEEEHKELLVDAEDRHKLVQRVNSAHIDMLDLYEDAQELQNDDPAAIRLSALIEYCYYLTKYLKEKRFKWLEDATYDYEANMFDYYFLYILEKEAIPMLKEQIVKKEIDSARVNRYYQYFVNFARSRYPFSLDNQHLRELTA